MGWILRSALCLAFLPHSANAFSLETVASDGCHERLTLFASRRMPWPGGAIAPAVSHEDQVLAANLPFQVPAGTDRWTLAMMIGVRDNDLEGHSPTDLPELAAVHGAADQSAHCLRSADQDFDQGDQAALSACRAFIRREISIALGGRAEPDLDATEEVTISLRYQRQTVTLSRYAFHMGRALHALQDSYAHSFRRPSDVTSSSASLSLAMPTEQAPTTDVMSVLNYIDPIFSVHFDELRDGHPHMSALDACAGSDFAVQRAKFAEDSSAQLLAAVGVATEDERQARVEAVLDQSLRYVSGCDPANEWCGADPLAALPRTHGCTTAPLLSTAALALLTLLRRRR